MPSIHHPSAIYATMSILTIRMTEALDYVHAYGFITNCMYRQLTGVSDRTAHRDLEMLVERGRLKGTGQRSTRRYVLA